ncbi:hypothetical protein B4113_3649 [Geobacillus sp. B4113_201601]|nr:hypothetical protein B4113_3649 [Geobacillus sp. B4113_201601]
MDDTIGQKTKPSSRAARAIQGCDWHYSPKDPPSVWGIRCCLRDPLFVSQDIEMNGMKNAHLHL